MEKTQLPAEGSLREYTDDQNTYIVQMYMFGVWKDVLRMPANIDVIFMALKFIDSNPDWPFPAPTIPGEEELQKASTKSEKLWPFPTKRKDESDFEAYDDAKKATEHL